MTEFLDLDNNIHWHSSTMKMCCNRCSKRVSNGYLVWNRDIKYRVFVCDACWDVILKEYDRQKTKKYGEVVEE